MGGLDDGGVVREPEVVVGAEVQHLPAALDLDVRALRRRHHELRLVRPLLAQAGEGLGELVLQLSVHQASVQSRMTLPELPERATAKASS